MTKARNLVIICWLVWGTISPVFSQEKTVLTLEESLRLALSQNPLYLASQEKIGGAQSQVRQAVANFFPTLNGQGMSNLDKKVFSVTFPSLIPGLPPQRVKLDFTKTYQFTMNFALPLFTGGRLISGLNTAQYNLASTKENVRQSRQDTVFSVKQAFYGCLLAKKFAEVAGEAVALAEKHFQNVKNLYDAGMASKFDLLRSEVQMANLKPQLIRARNGVEAAELGLKTLVGLDLDSPVEVRGELTFQPFDADENELMSRALSLRPEVRQMDYQRLMAGEMLKMAKAAYLPSVAVAGNLNYWADRFNFRNQNWESYYSFNLVISVPIFNGFVNSAKVAESKAMIKGLEYSRKGLLDMVRLEVKQAVLNLSQAKESLLSQEKNVEQAQETVRIAELNYSEGLATNLDVSTTQVALSQAKTNYAQALFDYALALAQLERAMGSGGDENQDAAVK
jgi:outer membrane protein